MERLADRLASGAVERVSVVPTSEATRSELKRLKIPTGSLDTHAVIDVVISSADAVVRGRRARANAVAARQATDWAARFAHGHRITSAT